MKIVKAEKEYLEFDNGKAIESNSYADYAYNYADFSELDDIALATDFDENLLFEECDFDGGFRFGNPGKMFFVPCYTEQNGYYERDCEIWYDGKVVLKSVEGDWN